MTLSRLFRNLFILLLVGVLAIIIFPSIDKSQHPSSQAPGLITFLGVGVTLIVVMAVTLYSGLKSTVSLQKQFVLYAILFNAFIIATKFILSPVILYNENQFMSFTGSLGIFGTGKGDPLFLSLAALGVFMLYFIFFFILYSLSKVKVDKALKSSDKTKKAIIKYGSRALLTIGLFSIIGFLIFGGGAMIFILYLPFAGAVEYISYLFSTSAGFLIALSLIGAILFISAALHDVAKQAILLRNAALLGSFFWIAISFLLVFHALWVVYFLLLLNLWPVKTVVPK